MIRARGRDQFYTVGGTSGGGGSSLLRTAEIVGGVVLGLGVVFVAAEAARPVIADVEAIEDAQTKRRPSLAHRVVRRVFRPRRKVV